MRRTTVASLLGIVVVLAAPAARAGVSEYFDSGSLIIPMDECHQFAGKTVAPAYRAAPLCYCPTGPSGGDMGVIRAYGLVFRLLQKGVTVKVILDTGKTAIESVDMTVQGVAEPVRLLNKTTNSETSFYASGCRPAGSTSYIHYRGMPFVIPYSTPTRPGGGNAALARALMRGGSASAPGAFSATTFTPVDVHVSKTGFWASVEHTLDEPLKPVALNDPADQGINAGVLQRYLVDAGLCTSVSNCNSAPHGGSACSPGEILGLFDAAADYNADCLTTTGYRVLWSPHWEATGATSNAIVAKMAAFVDAGNALMAECASVDTFETLSNGKFQTPNDITTNMNAGFSGMLDTWGNSTSEGFIYRDVSFTLAQKGDLDVDVGLGTVRTWRPTGGVATYRGGTSRFVSTCGGSDWDSTNRMCRRSATAAPGAFTNASSNWDVLSMRRKDGDPAKGPIVYLGGHSYNSSQPGGARWVLNTMLLLESLTEELSPRESSHAAPVMATIGTTETWVQGTQITYADPDEQVTTFTGGADAATFRFPYRVGKLRGIQATAITGTGTAYDGFGAPLWEAGAWLAGNPASSRTIFTHTRPLATGLATRPDKLMMVAASATSIEPFVGAGLSNPEVQTLIGLIRAGRFDDDGNRVAALGGIDWSTVAVIEPSTQVPGASTRPTMVYAAANDGMLHAVCAEAVSPCTTIGQELWAYIPQPQLARLPSNTQRLEGSPRVADLFGDFDGNGSREWRTVLTIASGHGDGAGAAAARPSVTAIDISAPGDPTILWERTTPMARGTLNFGVTMLPAMAHVLVDGQMTPLVFVATSNGGTGASGFHVDAYLATTGASAWSAPFAQHYPSPPRGVSGDGDVPASGIPGGVSLVSIAENGFADRVLVSTLYGDVWELRADDGTNGFGTGEPLFRFTENKHPIGAPPTIYRDPGSGAYFAVVVSGGYVDHSGAAQWVDATDSQYAVSVKIDANPAAVPIDETTIGPDVGFSVDLGPGEFGIAQATVSGNEVFVITSDVDVNSAGFGTGTGTLHQIDMVTGVRSTYDLDFAVASSAEAVGSTLYIGGTNKALKITASSWDGPGEAVEHIVEPTLSRNLWLITE